MERFGNVIRSALEVFKQNDGEVTKAYYAEMNALGPLAQIAVCLFRAQKRSSRAKDYRFRRAAYDVKAWSLQELCRMLNIHGGSTGIVWGWKEDPNVLFGDEPSQCLYVDLPGIGQCSFHNPIRLGGPEYLGEWSGVHNSDSVIIRFCDHVAQISLRAETPVRPETENAS